jgi:penicillin-binding protein 1C
MTRPKQAPPGSAADRTPDPAQGRPRQKRAGRRWLRWLQRGAIALIVLALGLRGGEFVWNLLDPWDPALLLVHGSSQRVHARDGSLLRVTPTEHGERLLRVGYEELPPLLVQGLVLKEDERFFEHGGVDVFAIARAFGQNLRQGRIVSGGSTLTMQLASVLDDTGRGILDKIVEARRARQIERALTKQEILAAYASVVPLGGTLRGFSAASLYWYGRELDELQVAELATLIAMLPAPSKRRPNAHNPSLRRARNKVLLLLLQAGHLSQADYARALAVNPYVEPVGFAWLAPHAVDWLLREDERAACLETTIDLELQQRIEEIVRRSDDHGVDGHAVVVLDRESGELRALLGSRSWRDIPFNGATAAHDAGSTLKPFLYALAYATGASSPERLERDVPIEEGSYRPRNFDLSFRGRVHASEALQRSRNVPAFRLLRRVGTGRFRHALEEHGIATPDHTLHLDLALGTIGVSPLSLARGYWKLADEARQGNRPASAVLEALSRAAPPGCHGRLRAPVSWKTGTSSQRRDAWCAAISADYVLVIWMGRLDGSPSPELVGLHSAAQLLGQLCLELAQ